jgi:hypothetical protein
VRQGRTWDLRQLFRCGESQHFMKEDGLILKLTCGEGPPTSGTQMISGEGLHRVNETNDAWMTEDVPLEVANKTLWEEALEMERTYRTGGLQET